ncbi:MAG: tetratricopeptide repeat protein [Acidobacteria bacterium]|nr:tetratricopeptide repeat protein [Acidobacteriota bacterium]
MKGFFQLRRATEALRQSLPGHRLDGATPRKDMTEGERLLKEGNFAEAEQWYVNLLAQVDGKSRRGKRARLLLALANAQWRQRKVRLAAETASMALESLDADEVSVEVAECSELLAEIALDQCDWKSAVKRRQRALEVQLQLRPVDSALLIERRRKLASAFREGGCPAEALEQLEAAYVMARQDCGDAHALTAECLVEVARVQSAVGKVEEARQSLESALEMHAAACGPESDEVARDYQALAEVCQNGEDLEGAIHYYELALRLRERQLGGSSAELATLMMELAGAHSFKGNLGPAVEFLQQAIGRFEGTRDERLAPALERLGTIYLLSGRAEDSIKVLRKARGIYEKEPDRNRRRIENNTELFATVSGYLPANRAAKLMTALSPATSPQQTAPATLAMSTARKDATDSSRAGRKLVAHAQAPVEPLPPAPEVALETWAVPARQDPPAPSASPSSPFGRLWGAPAEVDTAPLPPAMAVLPQNAASLPIGADSVTLPPGMVAVAMSPQDAASLTIGADSVTVPPGMVAVAMSPQDAASLTIGADSVTVPPGMVAVAMSPRDAASLTIGADSVTVPPGMVAVAMSPQDAASLVNRPSDGSAPIHGWEDLVCERLPI